MIFLLPFKSPLREQYRQKTTSKIVESSINGQVINKEHVKFKGNPTYYIIHILCRYFCCCWNHQLGNSIDSPILFKKSVMIHKSKIIKLYYTTPAIMLMNYTHSSINIQKRNDWEFRICLCLCILMHTKNSKNFLNGFKRQL